MLETEKELFNLETATWWDFFSEEVLAYECHPTLWIGDASKTQTYFDKKKQIGLRSTQVSNPIQSLNHEISETILPAHTGSYG